MKILLNGALQGIGGIQVHMRSFVKALDEAGHQVLCLSSNINTDKNQNESVAAQFKFPLSERVELLDLSQKPTGFASKLLELRSIVRRFNADILITTGHGMSNLMLAALMPKRTPRVYFEVMVGETKLSMRNPRRHYPRVYSHFVAQSDSVGKKLQVELDKKIAYVSICAFPQHHESLFSLPQPKRETPKRGALRMAYFGRVVPHKRPRLMANRFADVADLVGEYHIYGSGSEREPIEQVAKEYGYSDRIKCFGRYPEGEEYYKLLSTYDLLVLPTIGMEGSPLVLLEAMSCGVPYVACDTGGIRDYTFPEKHSCVTSKKDDDFVQGVRQVCETVIAGGVDRQALQQHFIEKYSFQACKRNWLQEIDRLVK